MCKRILRGEEMSLTDDWKAGKLPFGEYYCRVVGSPYIEKVMSDCMQDIVEILDKIPSYKQFQQMKAEIASLRELLKECKPLFFPYVKDMPLSRCEALNLLTRINAAIGESEEL